MGQSCNKTLQTSREVSHEKKKKKRMKKKRKNPLYLWFLKLTHLKMPRALWVALHKALPAG